MISIAKKICKYQGIKMHLEVMVLCPACGRRTLKLDLTENNAECIRCDKSYQTIEEVERLEEEKWLEDHEAYEYMMTERSGGNR